MADVIGGSGKDFFHPAGDGLAAPGGYNDIPYNPGDNVFGFQDDDIFIGGQGLYVGYGGYDVLDYSYYSQGVAFSNVDTGGYGRIQHHNGAVIAFFWLGLPPDLGTGFEEFRGTAYGDVLVGGLETFRLLGQGGDDTLTGGLNNETLDGGAGLDTASYLSSSAAVIVDLTIAGPQISGGDASDDVLISIENIIGSRFGDRLTGDGGDNVIAGAGGGDILNGGGGVDTVDYTASPDGVQIDLDLGTTLGGDATGDTLANFENATGSAYDDVLAGDAGANRLEGGSGRDTLMGMGGADTLIGGAGLDTADYSTSAAAVTVSLATGTGVGGDAQGDTLLGVENLTGSGLADSLAGQAGANRLTGGAGGDTLAGGGGDDLFSGAAAELEGDRITDFGIGDRILVSDATAGLRATLAGDQLTIWADGTGPGVVMTLAGRPAETVLVVDVAGKTVSLAAPPPLVDPVVIGGSEAGDLIRGNDLDNQIFAGGSEDVLYGGNGNDTIDAGTGDDFAQGNAGDDLILAGPGADTALGGQGDDRVEGGDGDDRLFGDRGADDLRGASGADVLQGNSGADTLDGGADTDLLLGGQDGDVLSGGAGDDLLSGDLGDDALSGGAGADVFIYARGGGRDAIVDFSSAEHDVIRLVGSGFSSFAELSGRISASGADTLISFDDGGTIRLTGVAASGLTADSFAFG